MIIGFMGTSSEIKIEQFARECDEIIKAMPVGDQEILGYVLKSRPSGFDWFFDQYFRSAEAINPYILEFKHYCEVPDSSLQVLA